MILRYPSGEAVDGHPTLAVWVDIENDRLKARLVFGNRQRANWPTVVPSNAILVPFDNGRDIDGVPIDKPTLQEIGYMLCKDSWQVCFRSTGLLRSLIMLAGTRVKKEGVAA